MTGYPNNIPAKLEIIKASEISAHLPVKRKTPGVSCHARGPGGAVLFCRLGFLAYASRSLRLRTKAAARIVTGRAMIQTSTPVSPVAGVLLPPV